jgi:arabinogalactan oligomer/maltooligosaccharide transport system substrate-binding protein
VPTDTAGLPTPSAQPTSQPSASPSVSPTPPAAAQAGTLTVWADNARIAAVQAAAGRYTATTGVPVVVDEVSLPNLGPQLTATLLAGQGPDIFVGKHEWLGDLVPAGAIEPLDIGANVDRFVSVALSAFTYTGQIYGVPYVSEAVAMYYNAAQVPTGGPPATWDELKTSAADMQHAGTATEAFCLPSSDPYHSYPLLTGFGGYIFGRAADGSYDPAQLGLDGDGALAYARELDAMVRAGLLRDGIDYNGCFDLMAGGESAFFITGPWALPGFNAASAQSGLVLKVAPIPMMANTPRPFVGVQGFMVNHLAPNKQDATVFLRDYISTDDTMRALWMADARVPAWKALADEVVDTNLRAFTDSTAVGDPIPAIPQMSAVWTPWAKALRTIFSQDYGPDAPDAEGAFRLAAAEIRSLIGH